ncbi:MAG: VacJ family lipoprotein [Alphaproteobacteria bacterium]|nr:VacJ family lipoprotein [Alphaproteobacteria bacterium]MBL6954426.1 VacJ family lipoprotein [Alphaproteobacteria bacterium]
MTRRGLVAAAMLIAGLLSYDQAAAASPDAAFSDYLKAMVRSASSGAANPQIRQRRVAAALSPLVTEAIVRQPGQIEAIMRGLLAAAPDAAPIVARQAMTNFPGFAGQIAHAAGVNISRIATMPRFSPWWSRPARQSEPSPRRANRDTVRIATWAISSIAGNPGALNDIMGQALAAAPGHEAALVTAVQTAYPGFARQIAAATAAPRPKAHRPASPRPVPRSPKAQPPVAQAQVILRAPVAKAPVIYQAAAPATATRAALLAPAGSTRLTEADQDLVEIDDPLEPMNRIIFAFNDTVDLILLRPIAIGYNWLMPDLALQAVRRAVLNLDAPVIAVNDLLQGDLIDAGVTVGRFGLNTTVGFLGLLDPAADLGLKRHHADFGQTLHSYSVGPGPYLVLPLIGPASTRGGAGKVVDVFFQPMTYLLSSFENLGVAATRAVVKREELLDPLDELRENSIDYYTGLKAAFWQARQVDLNKGAPVGLGDGGADKLFDAAN